jgi:transposase
MLVNKQEVHMPQTRPPYPPEFRQQILALVEAGRSIASLSKEFGLSEQSIRNWRKHADIDSGTRTDGLTTAERDELRRLRRENRRLQQERDILAKAAAWFARETGSIPSSSS